MSAEDRAKVKLITLINVAGGRNVLKRKQGEDWHEIARQARKQRHKPDDGAGKLDGVAENGKHIANGKASQEAVAAEVDDEDAKAGKRGRLVNLLELELISQRHGSNASRSIQKTV